MANEDSCRETRKVLTFWILQILVFIPLMMELECKVSNHDLEIRSFLKRLNKPYVKSIKSPDGDIIDCVMINLQPAFDNPLLKNHTIKMKPSSYPIGFPSKLSSNKKQLTQLWHTKGRCPKGTIPIRRTRKEDLRRATSIQSYGKKPLPTFFNKNSPPSDETNNIIHEYAVRYVEEGDFYGAKAEISVWNPRVMKASEFSLAQIWVSAGDKLDDLNTIESGWQVYPKLYGDNKTRLFGYWTRDGYINTGCYNLVCPGFVQTHNNVALGAVMSHVSSYNGDQYQISTFIFQDNESGDWWLQFRKNTIGYWPNSLFTHLKDSAARADWGGEVVRIGDDKEPSMTEMGSGHFSKEGWKKSANFIELQVVDRSNELVTPEDILTHVSNSGCYDLTALKSDYWGEFFYFGGPGRNPKCT